jgi:CBS domain-containing protein
VICPQCGHDNVPGAEECAGCLQDLTQFDLPRPSNRIERSLMEDSVLVLRPSLPVTIGQDASAGDAIRLLSERGLGALLVVDAQKRLVGILTERDLLMKAVGHVDDYEAVPVGQIMTHTPETVTSEDTLAFALHKMDGGGYRHLPVLRDGRPVGVISVRDVLRHVSQLC